jgi:hypothetical protein
VKSSKNDLEEGSFLYATPASGSNAEHDYEAIRGTSGGLIHPGRADVLCPSRFAELTGAVEAHNICSFPGLLAAEARGFKRGYAAGNSKNDCEINGESRTRLRQSAASAAGHFLTPALITTWRLALNS